MQHNRKVSGPLLECINLQIELSALSFDEISKTERGEPSADLDNSENIKMQHHISEAVGYRNLDRGNWAES